MFLVCDVVVGSGRVYVKTTYLVTFNSVDIGQQAYPITVEIPYRTDDRGVKELLRTTICKKENIQDCEITKFNKIWSE